MLTRLKVKGFKNLVDVDVRFGSFTCIAGRNGVGKSNLFDAILFLSDLTEKSLLEAVTGVRGETRSADALRIFSRWPGGGAETMNFEADMLVAQEAQDDLGQRAKPTITFLRYSLTIQAHSQADSSIPDLEVTDERLDYITKGDLGKELPFASGKKNWRESVFQGKRTSPFISTKDGNIQVHEDSGHQGRARAVAAQGLGRTVLSTLNTAETPTALVARREMQSWKLLQLEPAHLRMPDEMKARARLRPDGQGLAATLNRLLQKNGVQSSDSIRKRITNRLHDLIDDVNDVWIDPDDKREILTLMARSREGVEFRARDLSDGTLRFLALAVLEQDSTWGGLLCMEEPENGIHPTRVPAMLNLLQGLTVDIDDAVGDDNPLRQVIVNTHSPQVVGLVPDDCMVFADTESRTQGSSFCRALRFLPLADTWRAAQPDARTISKGEILEFLNALPVALRKDQEHGSESSSQVGRRPVAMRDDLQKYLPFPTSTSGKAQ